MVLGTLVATAVLTGALLVGDSVRFSLRRLALLRLGEIHYAVSSGERFFEQSLADRLEAVLKANAASALIMPGMAIRTPIGGEAGRQVNRVQVLGVDTQFWAFTGGPSVVLGEGDVALSGKLARALDAKPGDEISLRVRSPGLMAGDAPLSTRKERLYRRGLFKVACIVPDTQFGRFSLRADQAAPYNAFVSRSWLQGELGLVGKANTLLVGAVKDSAGNAAAASAALAGEWRIEDVGLHLKRRAELGVLQLESDRIFIEPQVGAAVLGSSATAAARPVGTLSYLVSSITRGEAAAKRTTPYSFMSAVSASADRRLSPVPPDMADDEIILSRWLADKLEAGIGNAVTVTWSRLQAAGRFVAESRSFRVRGILEMSDLAGEKDLMPAFPGLSDADRCEDWDIGMPMDEDLLKDKDNQAYWEQYRMTPKAIVTLAAGQSMWGSRFGNLMTVRCPLPAGSVGIALDEGGYRGEEQSGATVAALAERGESIEETLQRTITRAVSPSAVGLSFQPVREQAEQAVKGGKSLSDIFLGMSFFLILSALMLTALLFVFGAQQRAEEIGVLLAAGYRRAQVFRRLLCEGGVIALAGAVAGAWAGTAYTRVLLWALSGQWGPAVGGASIAYHAEWNTLLLSLAVGFVCAMTAMAVAIGSLMRQPAAALLSGDFGQDWQPGGNDARRRRLGRALPAAAALAAALVAAVLIAGVMIKPSKDPAPAFFGAGGLLLFAGMALAYGTLARLARGGGRPAGVRDPFTPLSVGTVGIRNLARRRWRSLSVLSMFACGTFMVFAVSAMRVDPGAHSELRNSGTGGFALFADSTLPIPEDLDTAGGRARLKLPESAEWAAARFVSMKVRDGDDAGCLNLTRPLMPRLLGVDPAPLAKRRAFADGGDDVWNLLSMELPDGTIPGLVGDRDTAEWNLRMEADPQHGAILTYTDEGGRPFKVRLVGRLPHRLTVLHGSILIPIQAFTERFPSESGYRTFLIEAPAVRAAAVRAAVAQGLATYGFEAMPAAERLKEFRAVENTYLAVFLTLGGLGLVLGSAGLGVVVVRNVFERRRELAALTSFGFTPAALRRMLWLEHGALLAAGLGCGSVSALVAVLPALLSPGAGVPYAGMLLTFAGVIGSGLAWTWLATFVSTRGDLLRALRNE